MVKKLTEIVVGDHGKLNTLDGRKERFGYPVGGGPTLIEVACTGMMTDNDSDMRTVRKQIAKRAPDEANAYELGSMKDSEPETRLRVAVQYYRIR